MSRLAEFLTYLSILHNKAKQDTLSQEERVHYEEHREELAQALLNAQKLTLRSGETARRALRVSRALQAELSFDNRVEKAVTIDLSSLGFSLLVGSPPATRAPFPFSLRLSNTETVTGTAVVVSVIQQPAHARLGCEIRTISETDRERILTLVFDEVLSKLRSGDPGRR